MNPRLEELLPGTRLIVRRRAYFHHGIYVGNGRVIHYAGWFHSARGLVEEVTTEQFTAGRRYSVGRAPANRQRGEQVVQRARSRLGERRYHLLRNNCEHFCNWCQLGECRSEQIEALKRPALVLFGLLQSVLHVGTGMAAPPAHPATTSLPHAHTTQGFVVRGDGAYYQLSSRAGLFVDYKEMTPANGALGPLQTGLPAMPPVRLGGFVVSAGIRVYLK